MLKYPVFVDPFQYTDAPFLLEEYQHPCLVQMTVFEMYDQRYGAVVMYLHVPTSCLPENCSET